MIRRFTPELLAEELAKRAYGSGALVVMTVFDWALIMQAYRSPLLESIANRVLEVTPVMKVESKALTFDIYEREPKATSTP